MKSRSLTDRILEVALGLAMIAFVGVLYVSLHDNVIKVGDSAPEFSVTTASGKTITNKSFPGKILVVNFWATWCPPCVEETPSLNEFAKAMAPKGLVVLGVSIDKDQKAYSEFLSRYGIAYETATNPDQSISTSFGTFGWPETYLIDRNGKVIEKYVSAVNWTSEQMMQHVQSLL